MPDVNKQFFYKLNEQENQLVEAKWEYKNKPIIAARAQERKYTGADIKPFDVFAKKEKEEKYFNPIFW
jgi:hypothetical protein